MIDLRHGNHRDRPQRPPPQHRLRRPAGCLPARSWPSRPTRSCASSRAGSVSHSGRSRVRSSGVASGIASIGASIAEIDRLRVDNGSLRAENERLLTENTPAPGDRPRERAADRPAPAPRRVRVPDRRRPRDRARVVGVPPRRDPRQGHERRHRASGDVVVAGGGALAGRVTEVGPDSATVVLLSDGTSTVIGQTVSNAATGQVVGQLGGVLVMEQIDSGEEISLGDEVVTRRHRAGRRGPLALPEGPADRPGRGRPARRERGRPDRLPAAGRRSRQARVRAGDPRLRGRAAAARGAADRLHRSGERRHVAGRRATVYRAVTAALSITSLGSPRDAILREPPLGGATDEGAPGQVSISSLGDGLVEGTSVASSVSSRGDESADVRRR